MRGFMLAAVVVAVVVMVRTAFGNEYDPCDDPKRVIRDTLDKAHKAYAGERDSQLIEQFIERLNIIGFAYRAYSDPHDLRPSIFSKIHRYLVENCQVTDAAVKGLITNVWENEWVPKIEAEHRAALREYFHKPYVGLYRQSTFAPKEWDMVALFGNGANEAHCMHAKKVITHESPSDAVYRCVQLPEDWRKRSVDEIVHTARQLDE